MLEWGSSHPECAREIDVIQSSFERGKSSDHPAPILHSAKNGASPDIPGKMRE
jgi:hypothetical protein